MLKGIRLTGFSFFALIASGCAQEVPETSSTEALTETTGAACCTLVQKSLDASSGRAGALLDCVEEAEEYCASGEGKTRCDIAAESMPVRPKVEAALDRSGCGFEADVSEKIARCEQFRFASILEGLPSEVADACLADVHEPMPAEFRDLYEGPQKCAEPSINGSWDLSIQTVTETGIPPNCHGTAAKIHGIDLAQVTTARDRSKWIEAPGYTKPASCKGAIGAEDVDITGYLVNMDHEQLGPESANDCGEPQFILTECGEGRPKATLFLLNMARACWDRVLDEHGFKKTPNTEPIRPGCMTTSPDHTISVVEREGAACQIYEKTSPYAPAWYRWVPCCRLANAAETYCPDKR